MIVLKWLLGLIARRRARLVAATAGVAIAVALLATIGAFLSSSKSTMTQRASATVTTDWQIEVQRGSDRNAVMASVRGDPSIRNATLVEFAQTSGLQSTTTPSTTTPSTTPATSGSAQPTQATTQTTGPGVVLGWPSSYRTSFPGAVRVLAGASTGVLLAQQTAANLRVAPGDTIMIGRLGMKPAAVTVDGIVDITSADSLFQKVGTQSQPSAPPDNILILPEAAWHRIFDPVASARPDLVTTQVHADFVASLPADPAAAYAKVIGRAQNLELRMHGAGLIGDNLAAELGKARSDALYAQVLFLFLGVPGAVLAGLLTATVASAGSTRRRGDQALLRARGAGIRTLIAIAIGETAVVAVAGSVIGLAAALVISARSFGSATAGASWLTVLSWVGASMVAAITISALSIAWPAYRDARELTVAAARGVVGRGRSPRWLRWWIDVLILAAAWLVYWLTSRNGFRLVFAVEGVPTISVSYWAFAAPALAWLGGGLMLWRISNAFLTHGRAALSKLLRPIAGPLSRTVAASMSRQRGLLSRALVLVALAVAFAASTSVFNSTYKHQAEVDAVLTNGAMVTVTESPGIPTDTTRVAALSHISGVRSVTSLLHRFAYVGADLQDLYGVDPRTIVKATKLQDAYFKGGTASQLMARLAARPDAILVSDETVRDFQLSPGDVVRLRLQNGRTKQFTTVPFTYAGIALEFPTAPSDSFLVASAAYVAKATGSDTVGTYLLDTASDASTAVAGRVRSLIGTTASVSDVASKRRKIGTSLTAVELRGLTRIELAFSLTLLAAAGGLVLWLGLVERRRMFAIAAALGATRAQLRSFVWSESLFVTAGGIACGTATGWLLTNMIVKVLTHVFDPPPSSLAVPWGYLGLVGFVTVAALSFASIAAVRGARRPTVEMLRDI